MLNLLPKDYKNKVKNEYLNRFLIVLLIGLSFLDIIFIVALFPSYTSINFRKNFAEKTSQELKNSAKAKDRDTVLSNIKDLEARMKIVTTLPGDRPTDFINKALELKQQGISIQNISYTKKDSDKKEVSLEGKASSRASLIDFSKKIKASEWATSSDIPLSNLANDKSIPFLVILTVTSTKKNEQ